MSTEETLRTLSKEFVTAANFWWNSLSQDFRCGHEKARKDQPLLPGCFCAQIRNTGPGGELNARGERRCTASLTEEFGLAA